jgi:S-DNA-T family DNA segregation ATPase FtsK/SpoIIIE
MASLIVVSGPNEGDYYPLGKRTIVVGRDEGCPIQITDERVSRKHLQLRVGAGETHVAFDMNSANGTRINGRQVSTEVELEDNDEIEIGNSKLVYTSGDFPDRESAFDHWKQRGHRSRPTMEQ